MNTLPHRNTAKQIITLVAQSHQMTVEALCSKTRLQSIAHPRQEAMATLVRSGRYSTVAVGQIFERDHTTIIHADRAVRRREDNDEALVERMRHFVLQAQEKAGPVPFRHTAPDRRQSVRFQRRAAQ